MKKILLPFLALAAAASAAAAPFQPKGPMLDFATAGKIDNPEQASVSTGASRASDGYTIKFCESIESWSRLQALYTMRQVIYVDADVATQLAGNRLASISYSMVLSNPVQGKVAVWEDPYGDPVVEKETELKNCYSASPYYQTVSFPTDDQYLIKANTPFFFGTEFTCTNTDDYPIGVDLSWPTPWAGYIICFQDGKHVGDLSAADMGTNLFCFARTIGDNTDLNNVFAVGDINIGDFTFPILGNNTSAGPSVAVRNFGSNTLSSLSYSYSVNGAEAVAGDLDIKVPGNSSQMVKLPVANLPEGNCTMSIDVTAINGIDPDCDEASLEFLSLGDKEGYPRKFVIEEGTGTWCGYCPRGIVGLEYMTTTYGSNVVPIGVHSGDNFAVNSYSPIINKYFSGFPSAIINRDPVYISDPSAQLLNACYNAWSSQVSPAMVDLKVARIADSKDLKVTATTEFCVDQQNYRFAFVITEDGLVGKQKNYFAGTTASMGGWEKMGSTVTWEYEHTARDITTATGIYDSLPYVLEAGKPYEYTTTISGSHISDVNETQVIALLLDVKSGTIVNAAKVWAKDYEQGEDSGIESAVSDDNAPVEYYNLQGVKVANPEAGVFIRVQGQKAAKVAL